MSVLNHAPFELAGRKTVLLAEGDFTTFGAKTAVCYLRYRTADVVAVVDSTRAGRSAGEILGFGGDIPVVENIAAAAVYAPEIAVVGLAPQGGQLDGALGQLIMDAIRHPMDIVSGLHTFLDKDPALRDAAAASGARLWDVRRVGEVSVISDGRGCTTGAKTVLVPGSDCNVGKMTATVELYNEATRRGVNVAWAATGQTGMMLRGRGIAIDRTIADFIGGATQQVVNFEGRDCDVVFVEGQGSLLHPGYAGVALGLTLGAAPDCQVLVHAASRDTIGETGISMPPLTEVVRRCEDVMKHIRTSPVAAIALNTAGYPSDEADAMIREARDATGRTVTDPVRHGSGPLLDAVLQSLGMDAK